MKPGDMIRLSKPALIAMATLGALAVAALLGAFAGLPAALSVIICALAVTLFPGIILGSALWSEGANSRTLPEQIAVSFACGLAVLTLLSFTGIVFRLRLYSLTLALTILCAALLIFIIVNLASAGGAGGGGRGAGNRVGVIILLAAAVALALATLWTPRDMDDWFYTAYISDYVEGRPVNTADALMGPPWESPPRAWFGAWWVAEALLSSISGVHPADFHQTYIPLVIFPFAILGIFTLARHVFRRERIAYLACLLQVVLFLSSAYPSDTAGWALFARTAQDKSFAFLFPAMVAASLGLRLVRPSHPNEDAPGRRFYLLYSLAVVTAGLVHPMGLVWSAVMVVPFAFVEFLRHRRRRSAMVVLLLLIPFLVCGLMLRPGAGATSLLQDVAPGPHEGRGLSTLFAPYLPGDPVRTEAGDRILSLNENTYIAHPLLVTRYPLAMAGLVLTFFALRWWKWSRSARFLVVLTAGVLVLAYVPGIAGLASGLITRKMLYRLTWLLPFGFTVAFFLTHVGLRLRWAYVIVLAIIFALCRGNPRDYFEMMARTRQTNRPDPDLIEVAHALAKEPAPRGVVLSPAIAGLMICTYVSEAYPAFVSPAYSTAYRHERIRTPRGIREFLATGYLDEDFMEVLYDMECRYILVRATSPLARNLESREAGFRQVYANRVYGLWEVPPRNGPPD
jgi:hypothetical protein